ncbi:hypothetical protein [Microlunatus parietis]|uniref:Uncharacterized protein n=1 Tax=Microlunatus parietis TaxID=682979 RepID=A0A7Y9L6Z8_9ACTN|nr:hypothetical protein [Microlunatus parietis]NYE69329.1 hypothetical protein [Microlunatus parietis]
MPDDWDWFWAGEHGRDRLLREEVETLSYQASAAASRASRMQSQLAKLQGSLETRLNALSKAFDAYVELGDVREELAGYPDTSAIRRDVMAVIEQLSNGLPASPVDPRGVDYWLPHATNTVIEIVGGDAEAGKSNLAATPEARLYVVAAVGALGHGERVADRLPELLITDRELTGQQVVLLDAVVAGVFGPKALESLEPSFRPLLQRTDPAGWRATIERITGVTNDDFILNWIRGQFAESTAAPSPDAQSSPPPAKPAAAGSTAGEADPRARLRGLVVSLIGSGYGGEGALLARARELRWQIENPGRTRPESEQGPAPVDALDRLVHHLKELPVGSPEQRTLLRWVAPGLQTFVEPLGTVAVRPPASVDIRTYYGSLPVTAAGPDQNRWQQIVRNVEEAGQLPPGKLYGFGIAAGVCAVLALICALTGQTVLAVLTIIAAVILGVMCAMQLRARHEAAEAARTGLDQVNQQLRDGVRRAELADTAAREAAEERQRLVDHIRANLARL